MEKDKLLSTARRYEKRNFKSSHFRRTYLSYCNNVQSVQPEQFKKIVAGTIDNIVDIDTYKTLKEDDEAINSFIKKYVETYCRMDGKS